MKQVELLRTDDAQTPIKAGAGVAQGGNTGRGHKMSEGPAMTTFISPHLASAWAGSICEAGGVSERRLVLGSDYSNPNATQDLPRQANLWPARGGRESTPSLTEPDLRSERGQNPHHVLIT